MEAGRGVVVVVEAGKEGVETSRDLGVLCLKDWSWTLEQNSIRNTWETNMRLETGRATRDSFNSRFLGSLWILTLDTSQSVSKGNPTLGWNEKNHSLRYYLTMLELLKKQKR